MLNIIWAGFMLTAFAVGLCKWLLTGQGEVFGQMMQATFDSARAAFEIALGLTGTMALWLGILKIGERGGMLALLTRFLAPFFRRLFPGIPADHPALGAMTMNISANMLGLDNAATPMGLQAMRELQSLNPSPQVASNAQILFMVMNSASVTIFPISILTYRAQMGAHDPADVFIPLLIATYAGALAGLLVTAWVQRIRLFDPVLLVYLAAVSLGIGGLVLGFARLPAAEMQRQSALLSHLALFSLMAVFIINALLKRVNVFDAFIEGAREGFQVAVGIIPYLVAMLVAVAVFRASGALDALLQGVRALVGHFHADTRFVDALPTAFMKPLSGSGARAMMIETMRQYGADSFAGRMASVIQGSTETTFYVLAVYFGSVGLRYSRHAIPCALLADVTGIVTAIAVSYLFFG